MAAYTTIDDPTAYFQTEIYTGSGSTGHARTFDSDTDMQPDMVWIKSRSYASVDHRLWDAVRGVTKTVMPSDNVTESTAYELTSFDSDGFTLNTTDNSANGSSKTYVAWCWKESATSGFDIVEYTGTGSAHTESHGLSAVPKFWLIKNLTDAEHWSSYHASLGATKNQYLNLTQAAATSDVYWNDTEPTSSVFTVGTENFMNENTKEFIAYIWAEKQGFSKFGQYIGNGNADGPFVYTGFRPAYILIKNTEAAKNWQIYDNKRSGYNKDNDQLFANTTAAEDTAEDALDILSNGFKIRVNSDPVNLNTDVMVYAAFAEAPFVNSEGVPCNAR
jgi:hypothetical protein